MKFPKHGEDAFAIKYLRDCFRPVKFMVIASRRDLFFFKTDDDDGEAMNYSLRWCNDPTRSRLGARVMAGQVIPGIARITPSASLRLLGWSRSQRGLIDLERQGD